MALLDKYKSEELVGVTQVQGNTSESGVFVFRGELILQLGKMHEASGKRNPPEAMLRQVVLVVKDDKITFIAGLLNSMEHLALVEERFSADFAAECQFVFYVEDLSKPVLYGVAGAKGSLIPYDEGIVWNELMDELYLEKSDFKGQSTEDKVLTVFKSLSDYKPKYDEVAADGLKALQRAVEKTDRGPV